MKTLKAAMFSIVATATVLGLPAFGQMCDLGGAPETTIRDPLIPGATSTAPLDVADPGAPPPIGDGPIPAPTNPGMSMVGGPTVIPSVPITPANDIESPSVEINVDPAQVSFPGDLGPNTYAPPPPSTPGADPGIIHAPLDYIPPPAQVANINPGGGISGGASNVRWGGQDTGDYGLYRNRGTKTNYLGEQLQGSNSEDGANHARSDATDTQDLYGNRYPLKQVTWTQLPQRQVNQSGQTGGQQQQTQGGQPTPPPFQLNQTWPSGQPHFIPVQ